MRKRKAGVDMGAIRAAKRDRTTLTRLVLRSIHCGNHRTSHIINNMQSVTPIVKAILSDLIQKGLVRTEENNKTIHSGTKGHLLSNKPKTRRVRNYFLTEKGTEISECIEKTEKSLENKHGN
jgi:predicted transcriptional regulator